MLSEAEHMRLHLSIVNVICERLEPLFKPDMKLTVIARHPTAAERHVIVTNDEVAGLRDLLAREVVKETLSEPNGGVEIQEHDGEPD